MAVVRSGLAAAGPLIEPATTAAAETATAAVASAVKRFRDFIVWSLPLLSRYAGAD
ncbi:MAG: hypothetical protein H0V25_06690 [Solirubrobacterales bacterium]|nr:hypothetical protein [Solirubrobacterales bacterium]